MQTIGIRSFSGPFDWFTTGNLKALLQVIENDFKDFLKKENLVRTFTNGNPREFTDVKYNFRYPHDLKKDLDEEYEAIRQQYLKRINRFEEKIRNPTVFIRILSNADETKYINNNRSYIEEIVKKGNSKNEILFAIRDKIPTPDWGICLPIDGIRDEHHLWHAFELYPKTLSFMRNLLSLEERRKNLLFYYSGGHIFSLFDSADCTSLSDFFSGKDWYIWGAGIYGNRLCDFLGLAGVRICGFIDSSPDKQGKAINDIKIYKWDAVAGEAKNVFVAMKDKDMEKKIRTQIYDTAPLVTAYGFTDLIIYAVKNIE